MTDLTITVSRHREFVVASVGGEIDAATAPTLREEIERLLSGDDRDLVIDLEAVTFIDSSGLGVLVAARRLCDGGRFRVVCTRPSTVKVLEMTSLGEVLGLSDSLDSATSS